jgi:hypothetical protein
MVAVLESKAAAKLKCEAIDVENGVFSFYAEDGSRLKPRFVRPNRRRLFGFIVEQGEYQLEPASGEDFDTDTFEIAIAEASGVEPNRYFSSLSEIRAHVKKGQNAHPEKIPARVPYIGT